MSMGVTNENPGKTWQLRHCLSANVIAATIHGTFNLFFNLVVDIILDNNSYYR
jgi:hypothetical protein